FCTYIISSPRHLPSFPTRRSSDLDVPGKDFGIVMIQRLFVKILPVDLAAVIFLDRPQILGNLRHLKRMCGNIMFLVLELARTADQLLQVVQTLKILMYTHYDSSFT